ncbi:MAG: hypothetical protein ABIP56_01410 [Dokdonella sp.]
MDPRFREDDDGIYGEGLSRLHDEGCEQPSTYAETTSGETGSSIAPPPAITST